MGCGCGGGSGTSAAQYDYVYIAPNGQTTTYGNQFEARARVLRDGGRWEKRPKAA